MAIINGKYLRGILGPLVFSVWPAESFSQTPGLPKEFLDYHPGLFEACEETDKPDIQPGDSMLSNYLKL